MALGRLFLFFFSFLFLGRSDSVYDTVDKKSTLENDGMIVIVVGPER